MLSMNNFVSDLKDRDHLAVMLNEDSMRAELLCQFVRRGIEYSYINVLFVWNEEEKQWKEFLRKDCISVDSSLL